MTHILRLLSYITRKKRYAKEVLDIYKTLIQKDYNKYKLELANALLYSGNLNSKNSEVLYDLVN